jgi:hypothetical protein
MLRMALKTGLFGRLSTRSYKFEKGNYSFASCVLGNKIKEAK